MQLQQLGKNYVFSLLAVSSLDFIEHTTQSHMCSFWNPNYFSCPSDFCFWAKAEVRSNANQPFLCSSLSQIKRWDHSRSGSSISRQIHSRDTPSSCLSLYHHPGCASLSLISGKLRAEFFWEMHFFRALKACKGLINKGWN